MQQIKVQTPAKINLTLELLGKRPDGFHELQSIMHAISLYDYLTITVEDSNKNKIELSGTSTEIPYDEKNIVHKAIIKYLETTKIENKKILVHIEKNIPVSAGLAGGSTNASGVFFGLNKIFNNILTTKQLHELASTLGSDLNFCLEGGCALCKGRGEIIEKLAPYDFKVSLIKPKSFGISAKEAYQKYALLKDKSYPNNTLIMSQTFKPELIFNSLEKAILPDYPVLNKIKTEIKNSMMSGSGPTFFVLNSTIPTNWINEEFDIFNNLTSVPFGVKEV